MPRSNAKSATETAAPDNRLASYDWEAILAEMNRTGHAVLPGLLSPCECRELATLYDTDALFRSHIRMARHGFGSGEYKYFAYPLPELVGALRRSLYPRLVSLANEWSERLRSERRYPADHAAFVAQCHAAGQERPTPLLLQYQAGDYNCLHQDIYGDLAFPIQAACLLSEPEKDFTGGDFTGGDFTGGEFVLTEQRPRMQSRPHVVPLRQGDAVLFAVNKRPVRGTRGDYAVTMRHGVSQVTRGHRCTLGIIFHDAR